MPHVLKLIVCHMIALIVYWPLARFSKVLDSFGINVSSIPLSAYRNKSFYTMRTDAHDRFGTRLEKRFTQKEILEMMEKAELKDIQFSPKEPFWVAVGIKQ
jgi:hypothetical protein